MFSKRLSYKHKNNKALYYARNYLRTLLPSKYYQKQLQTKLNALKDYDKKYIAGRVNYYNKLDDTFKLSTEAKALSELEIKKGTKTYFFDLYEYSRFFDQKLKGNFLFGDITSIPKEPGFVKSRPIGTTNQNSVLLKWNKVRHFIYVKSDIPFEDKEDKLISRGKVHPTQPQRIRFMETYFENPMCNIGKVNHNELNADWVVNRMTIDEQLAYKFILCIEGNDVASNLKWVMSSNSIAVMPKPKFETWFMEGQLIADHHYICIDDDYSNVEEKLHHYIAHPEEALAIIENAHNFVAQFKDRKREDLISLLVLQKYFQKSGQFSFSDSANT